MRAAPLIALVVVLGALAAGCAGGVPEGLTEVRVCTKGTFDAKRKECAEDERSRPLRARDFYCSARVGDRKGRSLVLRLLASGELVYTKRLVVPGNSVSVFGHLFRLEGTPFGDQPLLGGPWRCEIAVGGERLAARFLSAGPTDLVLDVRACRSRLTVSRGGASLCRRDESEAPIPSSLSVTCSALVAGAKGKAVRVDFRHAGRVAGTFRARIPHVSTPVAAHLSSQEKLPPGRYACRFLLGGRPVLTKPFTIG